MIAVMVTALLVAIDSASAQSQRKAVAGHFQVPSNAVRPSAASASSNVVANSGFESGAIDGGWYQCGDVNAYVTSEHPYSGAYDEYSGTIGGSGEPHGDSGLCQRVTVPVAGLLTARLYQLSNEGGATFAYQEADLLDDRGNVVVNLYKAVNYKAHGCWGSGI